jgi:hypothetical protein
MSEKNLWRKVEAVFKPVFMVVLFLTVFFGMAYCSDAEAEMRIEAGPTLLSGEYGDGGMLMFTEKFGDWSFGMGYITKQQVEDRAGDDNKLKENLFFQAQRHVEWKEIELGLGMAYFNNTNRALGKKMAASLSIHWNIDDQWSLGFRHYSNAGSGSPNMGQDALLVGWRF